MPVKNKLMVFDIDDTLTNSEVKHTNSLICGMNHFGITDINTDWRTYANATDSYVFSANYEKTHQKPFQMEFMSEFEEVMTEHFLSYPDTTEIKGAAALINAIQQNSSYAVCFATGSVGALAHLKLTQSNINYPVEVLAHSNAHFTREEIVRNAIEKAKDYYQVAQFDEIISFGDGLWDLKTARNLNIHFVGVNLKNQADLTAHGAQIILPDWKDFNLEQLEQLLEIKTTH